MPPRNSSSRESATSAFPTAMAEPTANQGSIAAAWCRTCSCSALGLDLPRTAAAMSKVGEEVERPNSSRVTSCSSIPCAGPSHVGVYLGDGGSFHSPSSGGKVRIEKLSVSYWASRFNGARRVLPENPLGAAAVSPSH